MATKADGFDPQKIFTTKIKILIVDDSVMDRQILIKTIKQHGLDNEILEASVCEMN